MTAEVYAKTHTSVQFTFTFYSEMLIFALFPFQAKITQREAGHGKHEIMQQRVMENV